MLGEPRRSGLAPNACSLKKSEFLPFTTELSCACGVAVAVYGMITVEDWSDLALGYPISPVIGSNTTQAFTREVTDDDVVGPRPPPWKANPNHAKGA